MMSGSLHRLGKLWTLSKCFSLAGCGPGYLAKVNYRVTPGLVRQCVGISQMRAMSGTSNGPSVTKEQTDDRIDMFTRADVQTLLVELTGRDYERIFRKRRPGHKVREPKYKFMTENELKEVKEKAEDRANKLLQMPPVLRARKPIEEVLSFDPEIQGRERSTIIFTDISANVRDRDRIIVARDPDGTLRQATWEERDKMNKVYFPSAGRDYLTPTMLTDPEALQEVLNRASEEDNSYEFVLDRASLQFEPDDPLYIFANETTFETIDRRGHYDFLKSTRHFGPMVFYLVRMRKMDGLLIHSVKEERISTDAMNLVNLFHLMFPESKSKNISSKDDDHIKKLKNYIEFDSIRRGELELALNVILEEEAKKQELEEGLKRQHGLQ